MMGFLVALPSEYGSIKAQILSSLEISYFQEILRPCLINY